MKKFYLGAFVLTALMASCSSANDPLEGDDSSVTVSEELTQIQLGASAPATTVETRALNLSKDAWTDGDAVGIFALPNKLDGVDTWTATNALLNNLQGTIAAHASDGTGHTTKSITFGTSQYYPKSSANNYSFYGYYPYNSATATAVAYSAAGALTVTNSFTGAEDVMAGVANAASGVNGYNAAWARTNTDVHPTIDFKHLTTSLQFIVNAGTATDGYDATKDECKIQKIVFLVPSTYTLNLASFDDTSSSSYFTTAPSITWPTSWNYTPAAADYTTAPTGYANNTVAESSTAILSSTTTTPIGEVLVPSGETTYKVAIYYKKGSGLSDPQICDIKLADNTAFLAGNRYKITITIKGIKEIILDATMTPWTDGSATTEIEG